MVEKYDKNILSSKIYPLKQIDKVCGIYRIRNVVNNKFYVGSAVDLKYRHKSHFSLLRSTTYNHHSKKLQDDFNLFGEEKFTFEVIQFCEPDERFNIEQKLLDEHWGKSYCYNASPYAIGCIANGKKTICLNDGKIFNTIKECCIFYNLEESGVSRNIQGKYEEPERRFTTLEIYKNMLEDGYEHYYIMKNYNSLVVNYNKYFNKNNTKPPVKYGKDNNRATSIICITDNIVFDTIKECCEYYNRDRSGIVKNINGKYENPLLKFTYKAIYEAMIKDGYNHEYILKNYNDLLKKYENMLYRGKKSKGKSGNKNNRATSIICLDDKKIFDTMQECIKFYKRDTSGITKNCQGKYMSPEIKFMYLETYNKAINDGYSFEYIYENHQQMILKYYKNNNKNINAHKNYNNKFNSNVDSKYKS